MKEFLESNDLLQTITANTERLNDDATRIVVNLNEQQLNWKPTPERWSIAQCLDHLTVSGEEFTPIITDAIVRGRKRWPVESPVRYRPTLLGGWLAKQLLPENPRKLPAPKIFKPTGSDIHDAFGRFLNQQKQILKLVADAKGFDYNKTRLRSPVTPLIRYSLADAFVIIVVHTQRHLAQAMRVRETPGFPA